MSNECLLLLPHHRHHTYENVLDVVLVDGDGGGVHEVQQQTQGLRVEVLEVHSATVLLQEARLEHPIKEGRAGAEDELVRREPLALNHQHRVREPIILSHGVKLEPRLTEVMRFDCFGILF